MIQLNVNGKDYEIDVDPDTPLLWVIRDHLKLPGTKYSCGIGECGACTVHMDGEAVPSCSVTAEEAAGREIVTIEGLKGKIAQALKDAWAEEDVPQCGYCQPGQIMTAANLLIRKPDPSDEEIDDAMSAVLCRCGTYSSIRRAIHRASAEIRS
jgi:aerobic-type carbon monoxide dehydrogenase small subunit (CoxS/CutS family)